MLMVDDNKDDYDAYVVDEGDVDGNGGGDGGDGDWCWSWRWFDFNPIS